MHRWGGYLGAVALALLLLGERQRALSFDVGQLGQVLKIMPPNGPPERYGNVVMRNRSKKASLPPVVFAHWSHRSRYACRVCHTQLEFAMRSGGSGITRERCLSGKFCGACHDGRSAFSIREPSQCGRCHAKDQAQLDREFRAFATDLPPASFGNRIDWKKSSAEGMIAPRQTLKGTNLKPPQSLQKSLDLGTGAPRSYVAFSHQQHMTEMDCSICHPDIFNIKKNGTRLFSMEVNVYGQFCGACHMLVAFPMNDCRRCHPEMSSNSFGF